MAISLCCLASRHDISFSLWISLSLCVHIATFSTTSVSSIRFAFNLQPSKHGLHPSHMSEWFKSDRDITSKSIAISDTTTTIFMKACNADVKVNESKISQVFDDDFMAKSFDDVEPKQPISGDNTKSSTLDLTKGSRPFPLGLIVDLTEIKKALILAAVNPRMGGVVISGRRGTGKSVLARAVHRLLPSHIERIKGNQYNIDPYGEEGIDSTLLNELEAANSSLKAMKTEIIPTPFVQIPLNVMEDSLIGTVDLELSIRKGSTMFSPGLLAKAHRGILYVDEINLLDEESTNILLNAIADGFVTVEREGLSVKYPCRPLMIATFNPEEGELREHLLDRIAITTSADATPLTIDERVRAVNNVIGFSGGTEEQKTFKTSKALENAIEEENIVRDAISDARVLLKEVRLDRSQLLYLCEEATRADCEGQRAEIFAAEIAKTCAALSGRTKVNADDLRTAVMLAIAPRGNYVFDNTPEKVEDDYLAPLVSPQPSSQPLPPQPPPPADTAENNEEQSNDDIEENNANEDVEGDEKGSEEPMALPDEFMFSADHVVVDPKLMKFAKWTRKGQGGKRARIFSLERGRYIKPIFPKGAKKGIKLAVGATLRAAAPYQLFRRKRAEGTRKERRLVYIDKSDFRIKKMARKAGTLVIFLADASGSMALNRMNAAKGAAISLLSEAYKSRDKICLIAFHGERAEILVPPTKSIALTKNRLEAMPCGGGSPLAHGLLTAMRTGLNVMKFKKDVGRVIIVCITDGRANIPISISLGEGFDPSSDPDSREGMPSRKFLREEVLAICKKLGSLSDFNLLCIDTEDKFVGTGLGQDIARVASGNYYHLEEAEVSAVSSIAKKGLEAAQKSIDTIRE